MKNELTTVKLTLENKMRSKKSPIQKIGNDNQNGGVKKNPQLMQKNAIKNKNLKIWANIYKKFMIFWIRNANFNNGNFKNYASKKYGKNISK